jgi:aspartyl protease family protein
MGHVWVKAKITNPLTATEVEEEALVDTGATYTVVPQRIYEKLGLKVVGAKDVETARGMARLDESFAVMEVEGKRGLTPLLISHDLKDLLVGVLTLEALGLTVDPTTGKLKEARILLL